MDTKLILRLLLEDIKHNQLINGLESIGLSDNDRYVTNLDIIIGELMGYGKSEIPDDWLSAYHAVMMNVLPELEEEQCLELATNLYRELLKVGS